MATTDPGKQRFRLRFVCPTQQAAVVESDLTGAFLEAQRAGEIPAAAPPSGD